MKKFNKNSSFTFYLAMVLFVVCCLSFNVTSRLYARFMSEGEASDSARVASFDVVVGYESVFPLAVTDLRPGDTREYSVSVNNQGEVAVMFSLFANNLTNNLPISIAPVSQSFAPNSSGSVTFTLKWCASADSPDYADKVDIINIQVSVSQID
ncbi:MAG: hypothetical protein IJD07_04490 [Clostridia bacterium]|nr:hypothetical protein [Clostridia bacterium]